MLSTILFIYKLICNPPNRNLPLIVKLAIMKTLTDFMALTLVVMLVIFITCGTQHTTLFITTLSLLFAVFSMYRMEKIASAAGGAAGAAPAGVPSAASKDKFVAGKNPAFLDELRPYPGAIELDADSQWPASAAGTRDQDRGDYAAAPKGNFYNYGRVSAPETAGPCADGEANADEIDLDEKNTYQVRSRNDPVRITAGTMRRQSEMDRYFREEVLEAEERVWWGRHEI
jgi:hypothetical protein